MILVLTGSNDFARQSELKKLTAAFIKEYGDFGLEVLEAGNVEFAVFSSTPNDTTPGPKHQ